MPYEPCVCTRAHMWDHEGKSHPWAALTLNSKDDAKAPPRAQGKSTMEAVILILNV